MDVTLITFVFIGVNKNVAVTAVAYNVNYMVGKKGNVGIISFPHISNSQW